MIQPLSIEVINNGQIVNDLNAAFEKAVQNCTDPQMPLAGARVVTLAFAIEPIAGNRERPVCQPSISVKLAEPAKPMQFLAVNVFKKEAFIENVEQTELFSDEPAGMAVIAPTLHSLLDGELVGEIDLALQQAIENVADPDTPAKGKRVVSCKFAFTLADDSSKRTRVTCQPKVEAKLQPRALAAVSLAVTATAQPNSFDMLPVYTDSQGATNA